MSAVREMVEEMVDELLDMEDEVVIAGIRFSRSAILREMDPVAYRQVVLEMADNLIADLQYEMESLDPEVDADEIADIQERIEELESI